MSVRGREGESECVRKGGREGESECVRKGGREGGRERERVIMRVKERRNTCSLTA